MKSGERTTAGIRRILFPTDFSREAHAALACAQQLSRVLDAEVTVMHSLNVNPVITALGSKEDADKALAATRRDARVELERLAGEFARSRTMLVDGSPEETIAQVGQHEADLIIMSTHGRSGIKRALLGSVAECVIRHSRVPVLTVRMQEDAVKAA